jgi:ketosteroid isomerase-like protein
MRITGKIIGVVLGLAVLSFAQAPKTKQGMDETSKALTIMEKKWVDALEQGDTATLDSILAGTYVDTDEEGHRTDKDGVLSALKSGDLKMQSINLSEVRVHPYGDAAVVTGDAAQKGTYKGKLLTSEVTFTDTFVQHNGKWRAVASHRSAKQ